MGGLGTALATNVLLRYANTATLVSNQIKTVSLSTADLKAQLGELGAQANNARARLESFGILYTRIRRSSSESAESTFSLTSTIQKGLQLGGASAQEAASAMIQFSQGLASNRLAGDELRAVLETPLGGYLAKGLGVTIGQLRKMGSDGELTANQVIRALKRIAPEVEEAFSKSLRTMDQAFQIADNNLTQYISSIDSSYAFTRKFGDAIVYASENLDTIGAAAGYAGLALVALGVSRGPVRLTAAFSAMRKAAKEELAGVTEDVAKMAEKTSAARITAEKAQLTSGVAHGTSMNVTKYADIDVVKEQARQEAALNKALAAREQTVKDLSNLEVQRSNAMATSAQMSTKAVALTTKMTEAERRLIALQQRESVARGNVRFYSKDVKTADVSFSSADERKAWMADARLMAAQSRSELKSITAERKVAAKEVGDYEAQISKLSSQRDRAAVNEHLAISRSMIQKRQQLEEQEAAIAARRTSYGAATTAVGVSGRSNIGATAKDTTSAYGAMAKELDAATVRLNAAAKAASLTGLAFNSLRAAGSSVLAFMGGWTGVAITGALVGLGMWAESSAAAAAESEAFNQKLREMGLLATETGEKLKTLSERRIEAIREERRGAEGQIRNRMGELGGIANSAGAISMGDYRGVFGISGVENPAASSYAELQKLINGFRDGKVTADAFNSALDGILSRTNDSGLDVMAGKARELVDQLKAAPEYLQKLQQEEGSVFRSQMMAPVVGVFNSDAVQSALESAQQFGTMAEYVIHYRTELALTARESQVLAEKTRILKEAGNALGPQANEIAAALAEQSVAAKETATAVDEAKRAYAEMFATINKMIGSGNLGMINAALQDPFSPEEAARRQKYLEDLRMANALAGAVPDTSTVAAAGSNPFADAQGKAFLDREAAKANVPTDEANIEAEAQRLYNEALAQGNGITLEAARNTARLIAEREQLNSATPPRPVADPRKDLSYIDPYDAAMANAGQTTAQLKMEQQALKLTTVEADALRRAFELLNQVQAQNGEVTPEQRKEIIKLASDQAVLADSNDKLRAKTEEMGKSASEAFTSIGQSIGQALAKTKDWKSVLTEVIMLLVNAAAKWAGPKIASVLGVETPTVSTESVASTVSKTLSSSTSNEAISSAQASNVIDLAAYREAIGSIESGGDYSAIGPKTSSGDRAYGKYQVMGNNIGPWTKDALGTSMSSQQFLNSPSAQDSVFNKQFGNSLAKYGNSNDAASVWFTGRPMATGSNATDILGTSGSQYVTKFTSKLETATNSLSDMDDTVGKVANSLDSTIKGGSTTGGVSSLIGGGGATTAAASQSASSGPLDLSQFTSGSSSGSTGTTGLFTNIFSGIGSTLSNLFSGVVKNSGSIFSSIFSALFNAKGNAFGPSGLTAFAGGGAFTNSIVNTPTMFRFGNGGNFGVMGEAGAEAVMPLSKDSSGRLGVSMNSGANDNWAASIGSMAKVAAGSKMSGGSSMSYRGGDTVIQGNITEDIWPKVQAQIEQSQAATKRDVARNFNSYYGMSKERD
ncbi:tape measure protein [Pleomorphomonas sp. PLEO]|uniref:tape measure protein n=1 Tax=Pleomorphomonas sp. PLEO TaxID=3239306 RepID=UPI00351E1FFC